MNDITEEVVSDAMKEFLEVHDKRIAADVLEEIVYLTYLIQLKDAQSLEFRKLTPTGKIQIEAAGKMMERLRGYLNREITVLRKGEEE